MPRHIVRDFGTCLNTGNFAGTVTSNSTLNLSGGAVTLTAWSRFSTFQTGSPYISSIAGIEDSPDNNLALIRLGDGTIGNNRKFNFGLRFASIVDLTSTTVIDPFKWYFLAGVYDGANMILYINGLQDAIAARTGSFTANNAYRVSGSAGGAFRQMSGRVHRTRAYTRALTPTEVFNLYYGKEPDPTGLQLYWEFNEGSGTTALDSSGNGRIGTIASCTYSSEVFMKARPILS